MTVASTRSNRREVRNPVLALPSVQAAMELPDEQRAIFVAILGDLVLDARSRAQISWKQNKGPMAAYWKAVGAYAHHLKRALSSVKPRKAKADEQSRLAA